MSQAMGSQAMVFDDPWRLMPRRLSGNMVWCSAAAWLPRALRGKVFLKLWHVGKRREDLVARDSLMQTASASHYIFILASLTFSFNTTFYCWFSFIFSATGIHRNVWFLGACLLTWCGVVRKAPKGRFWQHFFACRNSCVLTDLVSDVYVGGCGGCKVATPRRARLWVTLNNCNGVHPGMSSCTSSRWKMPLGPWTPES